jgi:hypothetical protein
MNVWQELDHLYESKMEDYTTWDVEDLQAELTDLNTWLKEVSDEASSIFYSSNFSSRRQEYDELQADAREFEQRRAAVLDALAKKGTDFLGVKAVYSDFLGHEVPDTQAREYLTTDGLITSVNMDSSAHSRPDWFTSQAEIDDAIKKFKCSGYHTKAGYSGGTDTFKTFTRDSYKQEQDFYKKPKDQRGQVAMRICKTNASGLSSIPKTGTVYFTGNADLPISEAPHWFSNISDAEDAWQQVKCDKLARHYSLEPVYKFLADKYNWQFSNVSTELDAVDWLRTNGFIIRTPEEEAAALADARKQLDAQLAEIKRINAIKDPVERDAAIKEFQKNKKF